MSYTNGLDDPTLYFNTNLYVGNGTDAHAITGVGFQPDFVWLKNRDDTNAHQAFDSIRGATKALFVNETSAEGTYSTTLQSFDSDGFTVGTSSGANTNANNFASWNWLAGGTASSNTDGSITSTVSANTTSGFSIVSYSGSTNSTFTVGHGLGVVPKIFILKKRSSSGTNWVMYNANLGNDKRIQLNNTDAEASTTGFGSTDPTSSVFTVANGSTTGANGEDYIAYCFAEKKGYSKFGSYTGNGSTDGTFVYTGFKPAFFITKNATDAGDNWILWDNKRDTFNLTDNGLAPNSSVAEFTDCHIDFVSNGIKIRNSTGRHNGTGDTHIYMAFAESPFVTSTGIPTTAR